MSPTADVAFPGDFSQAMVYKPEVPCVLVGPASFVVYSYATTTQPSYFFQVIWAELPTSHITS